VILSCRRKRIKDERFIDLIRQMLQAGVIEEGSYTRTSSGLRKVDWHRRYSAILCCTSLTAGWRTSGRLIHHR
jgi:hypothetical protein